MKLASSFRSVVPADFNTFKQKEGFLVFLQMVETMSVWEATCTIPLKNIIERTMEETARKLEDAIFFIFIFLSILLN